MAKLRVARRNF